MKRVQLNGDESMAHATLMAKLGNMIELSEKEAASQEAGEKPKKNKKAKS